MSYIAVNYVFTMAAIFSVAMSAQSSFASQNSEKMNHLDLEGRVTRLEKVVQLILEQIHQNRRPIDEEFISQSADLETPSNPMNNGLELEKKEMEIGKTKRWKRSPPVRNSRDAGSFKKPMTIWSWVLTLGLQETQKEVNELRNQMDNLQVQIHETAEQLQSIKATKDLPSTIFTDCQEVESEISEMTNDSLFPLREITVPFTYRNSDLEPENCFQNREPSALYSVNQTVLDRIRKQLIVWRAADVSCHFPFNKKYGRWQITISHLAAAADDVQLLGFLRWKGAHFNDTDFSQRTPLNYAVFFGSIQALNWLLDIGADIQRTDNYFLTPLHWAVAMKAIGAVEILIQRGADVNALNGQNVSSLEFAIGVKSEQLIQLLLDANVSIDHRNLFQISTLHVAALGNCWGCAKMLLEKGARTQQNEKLQTPLHFAAMCDAVETSRILIEHGADVHALALGKTSSLQLAVNGRSTRMMKLLLDLNVDINHQDGGGTSALHKAIEAKCLDCMEVLLDRGASINHQDKSGISALHIAVKKDCVNCMEILLERGARIDLVTDFMRESVLLWAVSRKCLDCVKMLLERGIPINLQDINGQSALHIAVNQNWTDGVKLLLDYKIDTRLRNRQGKTAYDLAASQRYKDILALFLSKST